jgi:hypothetical protein
MQDPFKQAREATEHIQKLMKELSAPSKAAEELQKILSAQRLPSLRLPSEPAPLPRPNIPTFPTVEETNTFQSSGMLLRRLANAISQWRAQLPQDVQPGIIAILHGGIQIEVDCLAEESCHGIRIEGRFGGSPCVLLAHQATVQLLCYVQPIQPPEHPRRSIGFVIGGEESEA